jgi:hypothetical protein
MLKKKKAIISMSEVVVNEADTSKKGIYVQQNASGKWKVSINVGNTDFAKTMNDEFPTEARAMKFANSILKHHKGVKSVTKLPSLREESVVNEAKYDIGMARKGNGLTIYNKAEEENGDYKNVAHIDNKGKVKYLDKKIPSNIKKEIEAEAKKMMEITNEGNSMIKLKNLLNESFGFGELPSSKLMKMKVSAKDMLDSVNPKKVNESEEDESITEARESAKNLLQSVVDGETKEVEGIKLSKEMAEAYLNWLRMSPFGKKYGKLPFNKLFTASFRWGLHRHADEKSKEYKDLKAKAKSIGKG